MSRSTGKRRFHFKNVRLRDPAIQRFGEWSMANRGFYGDFRNWLKASGYGESALNIYGAAARMGMGFLRKPYWQIDPQADIQRVIKHLLSSYRTSSTQADYQKGLAKLAHYLRLRCHRPPQELQIRWNDNIGSLESALQADVRDFIRFCQHAWTAEQRPERSCDKLYALARPLRWMAEHCNLTQIADLTPQVWYAYLDQRLGAGIKPDTTNGELSALRHFVYFLQQQERPVCDRFLLVQRLEEGYDLPKDVPLVQLKRLQAVIQLQSSWGNAGVRRLGRMDLAWFLLMLHCGLRTGEVRHLKLGDLEWEARRARIRQSKGLKDRLIYLNQPVLRALQAYLELRGPLDGLPENVFIFRHAPLSRTYCFARLRTYGARCGVRVAPHQLRHSCATLLLNAGAPVLSVQMILGHKQIDTTLGYARLYDGTVAADYYAAMTRIEHQLALPEDQTVEVPGLGQLIALTDALHRGPLNPAQVEIVRSLRDGLSRLAEREQLFADVKVQEMGATQSKPATA